MYKLESSILECEINIVDGILSTSKIYNKSSKMEFVPDGGSSEFEIKFIDGDSISSKSLRVDKYAEKDGKFYIRFKEAADTVVTLCYMVSDDNKYLEKQLSIKQSAEKDIDYVTLENIGINNSQTYFTVPDIDTDMTYMNLGQPFYIDSLFFGCEFPATRNGVFNGRGQVRLYLGKNAFNTIICPKTVIGGAKSNLMVDLKKSFFEYIDSISQQNELRVNYNPWFDCKMNINTDIIQKKFYDVENMLTSHGVSPIDSYVIDDGWNNYKEKFWNISRSKFPNGLIDVSKCAEKLGSSFGLWISPRGGYDFTRKFAKKIESGKMGYYNAEDDDICVGSKRYMENFGKFILKTTLENDISYWKLDGFCKNPCMNAQHDHVVGGEKKMYYMTEMWGGYIRILKALRVLREKQGKSLFINLTCYVNPSPWLLQFANTIWLQEALDIGFSENYSLSSQSQLDAMITYRDSGYYDFLSNRAYQVTARAIFNHDPIYAKEVDMTFSNEEFEKMLYWNACRGSSLLELYLSVEMMNDTKWQSLSNVIKWQRDNYNILKHAMFLGGDPADNNIYCFASWNNSQAGIIALRNPSKELASLTLTLNKLMGCPENLSDVECYNVYNKSDDDNVGKLYSYGDKIDLTLNPFEIKIYQFSKLQTDIDEKEVNDFTIVFNTDGQDETICSNENISIKTDNGYIKIMMGSLCFQSESSIRSSQHNVTIVREKNKMVKLYIDKFLDCSAYDRNQIAHIPTDFKNETTRFNVYDNALPYNKIVSFSDNHKKKKSK